MRLIEDSEWRSSETNTALIADEVKIQLGKKTRSGRLSANTP
jgi:hypothetical protein